MEMELSRAERDVIRDFALNSCFYDEPLFFDDCYFDSEEEAMNYYNAYKSVCEKFELNPAELSKIVSQKRYGEDGYDFSIKIVEK